jgi:cysteine desulfurase
LVHADTAAREAENARLVGLRDHLLSGLLQIPGTMITGHPTERLPNSASVVFEGVEGGDLVAALDLEGIEASTGSACTTGAVDPSHVLLAMGIDPGLARGSLRLTLGRSTSQPDVDRALEFIGSIVGRLRASVARQAIPSPA